MTKTLQRYFTPDILPPHKPYEIEEIDLSVKTHGQLRPIITYQGKILDGFIVYEKCLKYGLTPKFQEFSNTTISAEEYRLLTVWGRQLSVSQKAALAVAYYEAVKKRGCQGKNYIPKYDTLYQNRTIVEVGKKFGVSSSSIQKAKTIKTRNPELFKQVSDGEITVKAAHRKVNTPRGAPQSAARSESIDRRARNVLNDFDFQDYKPPASIHVFDDEAWKFDRYMKHKGYNLCLTRVGDSWDAVYTKSGSKAYGFTTWKAAVIGSGKQILERLANDVS